MEIAGKVGRSLVMGVADNDLDLSVDAIVPEQAPGMRGELMGWREGNHLSGVHGVWVAGGKAPSETYDAQYDNSCSSR